MSKKFIGQKVIARMKNAGVFFGTLIEVDGSDIVMENVRKLWRWEGACAVEEISQIGTNNESGCKFTVTIPEMAIKNWVQILPCTKKAIEVIEGVKEWKY